MKKIAVIILTWNSRQHLSVCLSSVFKQTLPREDYDVIVVDNASADGSADLVEEGYPQAVLIRNNANYGYAGGNNIGLKYAYENNYQYFVVLNDDMKVADNWLAELVKLADSRNDIAIIQSKILFMQKEYRVNTVGNPLHPLAFSWSGGYKELSSNFLNNTPIAVASGACFLVKREVIQVIGYLEEAMFMYHEDLDFSWRARLAGFDIWLAAESKVYHDHNFSIGGKKFFFSERNRLIAYFSNFKIWTLLVFAPIFVITEIGMIFYSFYFGWGWLKLKSYLSFTAQIPRILEKRKQASLIRKISDRQIFKIMTLRLDFEDVNNFFISYLYNPLSFIYFKVASLILF